MIPTGRGYPPAYPTRYTRQAQQRQIDLALQQQQDQHLQEQQQKRERQLLQQQQQHHHQQQQQHLQRHRQQQQQQQLQQQRQKQLQHQRQQQQRQPHLQQPLPHTSSMLASQSPPQPKRAIIAQNLSAPGVRFKELPFYETLRVFLKPTTLAPRSNPGVTQELSFQLILDCKSADELGMNRDLVPGTTNKYEYDVQVLVRFCRKDTTTEQEDCFPPNLVLKINDKPFPLPVPPPANKTGAEHKRLPRPVNVTPLIKISPIVYNTINVQWIPETNISYVVVANIVRKKPADELLKDMAGRTKPEEFTRTLIIEKLREDEDCQISTLRVSLQCSVGKSRILIPARGEMCRHIPCFDASVFLKMNEKRSTWTCPICDKPVPYEQLYIDAYFENILSSPLLPRSAKEVEVYPDGNWALVSDLNETSVDTVIPKENNEEIECIELSDSDDETTTFLPFIRNIMAEPEPEQDRESNNYASTSSAVNAIPESQSPTVIDLDDD